MDGNTELDKIISEGKINPQIAMTVFAIELRAMKEKVNEVKNILDGDDRKFATKEEVAFLRNIIFGLIGIILTSFILAVAKGVFK